ncbi:MAG: hypothetical protein IT455_21270 [Planctomycetes bacterium]|nr:hypothetical protein [Planctomycetota bacterium]
MAIGTWNVLLIAVVAGSAAGAGADAPLWSLPSDRDGAERVGALPLQPGDRYPLLEIDSGPEASRGTSAEAYRVWYRIATPTSDAAWLQAVVPSAATTGQDSRPSSLNPIALPAIYVGEAAT